MIIIRLMGGLGNQMFQYSLGKNLSIKNNTVLKIDKSWFDQESNQFRKYELDIFAISAASASPQEISTLKYKRGIRGRLKKITDRYCPYYRRSWVKQQGMYFDLNILKAGDNSYIDGYWQSEKYFKEIKNELLEEFKLTGELDEANRQMLDKIFKVNSAGIHIRRGDYVKNKKTNEFHGTCSIDYYNEAVRIINNEISQVHWFVFSDEINWAKINLKLPGETTFVDINNDKNYGDLILMSKCKHQIIANSSFSWWAAWLNNYKQKIVIAPRKWFNLEPENFKIEDLIPDSWKKI
ncbi:MAG: alpha-1,2-fucosyltransferase [bacterium]